MFQFVIIASSFSIGSIIDSEYTNYSIVQGFTKYSNVLDSTNYYILLGFYNYSNVLDSTNYYILLGFTKYSNALDSTNYCILLYCCINFYCPTPTDFNSSVSTGSNRFYSYSIHIIDSLIPASQTECFKKDFVLEQIQEQIKVIYYKTKVIQKKAKVIQEWVDERQ